MFLDKVEEQYKKHKNVVKTITGMGLGLVVGMWFYGKYKGSKVNKTVEKVQKIGEAISGQEN